MSNKHTYIQIDHERVRVPAAHRRSKTERAPPAALPGPCAEAHFRGDAHLGVAAHVWAQPQRAFHEPDDPTR